MSPLSSTIALVSVLVLDFVMRNLAMNDPSHMICTQMVQQPENFVVLSCLGQEAENDVKQTPPAIAMATNSTTFTDTITPPSPPPSLKKKKSDGGQGRTMACTPCRERKSKVCTARSQSGYCIAREYVKHAAVSPKDGDAMIKRSNCISDRRPE